MKFSGLYPAAIGLTAVAIALGGLRPTSAAGTGETESGALTLRGSYEHAIANSLKEKVDEREPKWGGDRLSQPRERQQQMVEEQDKNVRSLKKGKKGKGKKSDEKKYKNSSVEWQPIEKEKEDSDEEKKAKKLQEKLNNNNEKEEKDDETKKENGGTKPDVNVESVGGSLNEGGFDAGNSGPTMCYNGFLKAYKKQIDPETGLPYRTWPPHKMVVCTSTSQCPESCCCLNHAGLFTYCVEDYTVASQYCMVDP